MILKGQQAYIINGLYGQHRPNTINDYYADYGVEKRKFRCGEEYRVRATCIGRSQANLD